MTLPAHVIKRDDELDAAYGEAGNALMEHRWHWTLDETNAKRVPIREYARTVGKAESTIRGDVNGWRDYVASQSARAGTRTPGEAQTPSEFRQNARYGAEKRSAVEAIARTSGRSVNAASRDTDAINAVVNNARERAEKRGTTVESEIETAAERREKARKAAAKLDDERKKRMTAAYISIEGDIGVAMQRLRRALETAKGVEFGDNETELLTDAMSRLRALMNLVDLRFTGEADINWDAELEKIS